MATTPTPTPEFTYADLLAIDAAIKSGANMVKFADREMQYNTLEDMLKARQIIQQYLAGAGTPLRKQYRVFTGTGW